MSGSTHTVTIAGYVVTVWMISLYQWAYRITRGDEYYRGNVEAMNWMDAARNALEEAA